MEMNERMKQLEKRIAWLEKLKAEDERAILILHEQNENLQRQIEKIKERLSGPDAKRAEEAKAERTRQDVMKEIASLTLGPDYERKMEMAREAVEKRLQE